MNKALLISFIAAALSSCGKKNIFGDFPGTEIPVSVTIIKVENNEDAKSWLGCNSEYVSWVKNESGFVDEHCGYLGAEGDTVSGFWVSDAAGIYRNGFRAN